MLGLLLLSLLGQAPVPELPAVSVRVSFTCASGSQELVLAPKALVAVPVPEGCPGAGKALHLELACSERCGGHVSAGGARIAELFGPGARTIFLIEQPFRLAIAPTPGANSGAVVAALRLDVLPDKKVAVPLDLGEDLWVHFFWDEPQMGAIGMRVEPGELVTIDDKAGVLARLDRVEPARVRVRVWCGRNESDDAVVDQVLPFPEGKMTASCNGLGGLCSGPVEISVREP